MSKVSVVMAVYNGEAYLRQAIESILGQTFKDFEFIIIDDGSTDNTANIINTFKDKRVSSIKHKNRQGLTISLNTGFRLAKGKYIARMDADDISYPQRLEHQIRLMDQDKNIALVGSWAELIDKDGKVVGKRLFPTSYASIRRNILRYNPFIHPSVVIRQSVLKKVGYYEENLDGAEDYDLFLRIAKKYKAVNMPNILLKYRLWPGRISYRQLKKVERAAIITRIKALRVYGYPRWQAVYLAKPLISYLIPASLKRLLLSKI